jgi:hypothetical protein
MAAAVVVEGAEIAMMLGFRSFEFFVFYFGKSK